MLTKQNLDKRKLYREQHKEELKEYHRRYLKEHRNELLNYKRDWYQKNKDRLAEIAKTEDARKVKRLNDKKYRDSLAKYDSWYEKLFPYHHDELRRDQENPELLQVRCKYDGKWFNPRNIQVINRLSSIRGTGRTSTYEFYCSDACKRACPMFGKQKYLRGNEPATSREVPSELRKMVLDRDNWTCQKCGQFKEDNLELELHCHHIDPVVNNPIESSDINNCITLCKECHQFVHNKLPGCKLGELSKCGKNSETKKI